MKSLLMLAGYTAYQAECLSPFLWIFFAGFMIYVFGQVWDQIHESKKNSGGRK